MQREKERKTIAKRHVSQREKRPDDVRKKFKLQTQASTERKREGKRKRGGSWKQREEKARKKEEEIEEAEKKKKLAPSQPAFG